MKKIILLLGIFSAFMFISCASSKPTEQFPEVPAGNSVLVVQRERSYAGSAREIRIILDSVQIGALENGETKEFSISDGKHTIRTSGGFGTGDDSEQLTFEVYSRKIWFLTGFGTSLNPFHYPKRLIKRSEFNLNKGAAAPSKKPVANEQKAPTKETKPAVPTKPGKVFNLAVVETEVDLQPGSAKDISKTDVREITKELRRQAVKYLPRTRFNVMTSETVQAQGSAVLNECDGENCVITLGSKIGADYIVRGTISKFQKLFTLSVEIYDTEDGNLIASAEPVRSEKILDLLEKSSKVCADMYKKLVEELR